MNKKLVEKLVVAVLDHLEENDDPSTIVVVGLGDSEVRISTVLRDTWDLVNG